MNKIQKWIMERSEVIDDQSGGVVKITYAKIGCFYRFYLYVAGTKVSDMATNEAHSFCRAWTLSRDTINTMSNSEVDTVLKYNQTH